MQCLFDRCELLVRFVVLCYKLKMCLSNRRVSNMPLLDIWSLSRAFCVQTKAYK